MTDTNRWPSPTRLAIGLSKAGFNVSAVCMSPGHPLLKTRAVRQTFRYSGLRPLESLRVAIDATDPQIIIPCDDRGVQHLHQLHAQACAFGPSESKLAALIERSLGSPDSYPIVSKRYDLLRIAEMEGIRIPHTQLVKTVDDLKAWQERQTFPWMLKLDGTWGGRGVRTAHTPAQAKQLFLELTRRPSVAEVGKQLIMSRDRSWVWPRRNRSRPSVIAQAHIFGRPANCAFVCWKGQVLAGIGVEVVSAQGKDGPANVVRIVHNHAMMVAAEKIARRLSLSGFFGLDFMIEDKSAATYLIEMNPRCTPLSHLQLGKGRDLVEALWAQESGHSLRDVPTVTRNAMIAYFPQASICKSKFLESSFHDVPREEPDLNQELLRPWSERSFVARMVDRFRRLTRAERASKEYIFAAAVSTETEFSEACAKPEDTRYPPRGWAGMPKNVL
jgi:Carbamoyl-phosphate synthase L chain, ATP binding domain